MDIRHLKIFIAVAETGSMSAAAKKFFITQPSVSQVIKELENHYHLLLFERLGKRLFITPAGKQLCDQAHIVVRQFEALEKNISTLGHKEVIRIGSTITIGACLLPSLITDFKNPNIESFCYVNNTKMIENKLLKAELDIGLVEGKISHPDLIVEPVIDDYLVIACSRAHPFAGRQKLAAQELENEIFVLREKGSGTRDLFMDFARSKDLTLNIGWEVTSPEIIKTIVIKNKCLAAISIRLIEEEVRTDEIYAIRHQSPIWNRTFNLVYHKDKHISPAMSDFMEVARRYGNTGSVKALSLGQLS
ncbi:LysR family transcriptional regulator [Acetobacterium wieringae]|uniref:LysR family transcriptional regulator n=1 Tax=Acetobacterium wieringae TaxID=52694 RepID=UPI00315877A0